MDRWFVKKEGLVLGPYSVEGMRTYVARGKVTERDLVSGDGEAGWPSIRNLRLRHDQNVRSDAPGRGPYRAGLAPHRDVHNAALGETP